MTRALCGEHGAPLTASVTLTRFRCPQGCVLVLADLADEIPIHVDPSDGACWVPDED